MKVDGLRLTLLSNAVIHIIVDYYNNLVVGGGFKTISQTKIFSSSNHPIQRVKKFSILYTQSLIEPFFFLEKWLPKTIQK